MKNFLTDFEKISEFWKKHIYVVNNAKKIRKHTSRFLAYSAASSAT